MIPGVSFPELDSSTISWSLLVSNSVSNEQGLPADSDIYSFVECSSTARTDCWKKNNWGSWEI